MNDKTDRKKAFNKLVHAYRAAVRKEHGWHIHNQTHIFTDCAAEEEAKAERDRLEKLVMSRYAEDCNV